MQKTLRINIQSRNQLVKRLQKKKASETRAEWKQWRQQKIVKDRKALDYVREERAHRREDWLLGPLAPNRDAGTSKGVFGAVDVELLQTPAVPKAVKGTPKVPGFDARDYEGVDQRLKFKGQGIVGNVVVNDRVVVIKGRDGVKGMIGFVIGIDEEAETLRVQNVNVADVRVSPAQPGVEDDTPTFNTMEMPIPMSHVRLVGSLQSGQGETGTGSTATQDVIIRHVYAAGPYAQRATGSNLPAHTRYVAGTGHANDENPGHDIQLPWPAAVNDSNFRTHPSDTAQTPLEESTWVPSVYHTQLGYHFDVMVNKNSIGDARAPYTLGLVKDWQEADNKERTGLHGFVDPDKLVARRDRISKGIMNELRSKTRSARVLHDDTAWVKQKIMEDARAIWWRDRKIMTPATEAAERAAEQKRREREERIIAETKVDDVEILEGRGNELTVQPKLRLARETEDLVRSMQEAALQARYERSDMKFRKRLARMTE